MCQFFSFVTKGNQKFYFNWEQRKALLKDNPKDYEPDSHTSICAFHSINEDKVNKYEFNPLTRAFQTDQINIKDNQGLAKKWVKGLDFKTIVKPLQLNKIINPFDIDPPKITNHHIELVKLWASVRASVWALVWDSVRASVWDSAWDSVGASVRASVWASVWDSVGASVWDSVGDSVWDSVGASVRDSVGDSVGASVWASVGASVRDSVWDSVRASVWAYISDFFLLDDWENIKHEKGENPFNPCIELWKQGIVPSFDGEKWRLHTKEGIVWEGKI